MSASSRDPRSLAPMLLAFSRSLVFQMLMVFLVVVLLDAMWTRFDFSRRMMMSRREVKEEVRRREGDPHVRMRIRELQKEAAARTGSLAAVPDADVIITNPTRIAVALRYDREKMPAPVVLSKGAGELAAKIRELGRQHGVPILEDKPLAQVLFREAAIDQPVPEVHYEAVATIFAQVLRRKARSGSSDPRRAN